MVPSAIKISKEQLNVLAYADDTVLIGKNEMKIRQLFVEIKLGLQINKEKYQKYDMETKSCSNIKIK
jgi:hypothetical protein